MIKLSLVLTSALGTVGALAQQAAEALKTIREPAGSGLCTTSGWTVEPKNFPEFP